MAGMLDADQARLLRAARAVLEAKSRGDTAPAIKALREAVERADFGIASQAGKAVRAFSAASRRVP